MIWHGLSFPTGFCTWSHSAGSHLDSGRLFWEPGSYIVPIINAVHLLPSPTSNLWFRILISRFAFLLWQSSLLFLCQKAFYVTPSLVTADTSGWQSWLIRLHSNLIVSFFPLQLCYFCSHSPYVRRGIFNLRGVKYADLLFLVVAMVNRNIGDPLMLTFYSPGAHM